MQTRQVTRLAWLLTAALLWFTTGSSAYQVLVSSDDEVRQICSGMWGHGKLDPFIEVIFAPSSRGQLALVVYEWADAPYLGVGIDGEGSDELVEDDSKRVYVCTLSAMHSNLCTESQLGTFITSVPEGSSDSSSIFTTSVRFDKVPGAPAQSYTGTGPYRYDVTRTGYYCVGTVPLVVEGTASNSTSSYTGVVEFSNVFDGHLPAGEHPKVTFYFVLLLVYAVLAAGWTALCIKHRRELLPIQHYLSATLALLVIEMLFVWSYYKYLNDVGAPAVAKILLIVVSVLNAGRHSLTLFLLLITAMGYGIMRQTLGPVMLKIRLLAAVHFVFGVLYSLGIVSFPLEGAGVFILFFVFPLALSLTAFLMWIMWSLNATIAELGARRQLHKQQMFTRLYRILIAAVLVVLAFFVVTSLSFTSRNNPNYAPETWKTRWILLDGWLAILYLAVFCAVAFLWRPNSNNKRFLMSDELATDEQDAYDPDALEREMGDGEEREFHPMHDVGKDSVVFDVGDDDDEEHAASRPAAANGREPEERQLLRRESDSSDRPPSYKRD